MADKEKREVWFVDFDATLATYDGWKGPNTPLGDPIPLMVRKVKAALKEGHKIAIFSARTYPGSDYERALEATQATLEIAQWCQNVFGEIFPITFCKLPCASKFIDDRAEQVLENTGIYITELLEEARK